MHTSIYYSITGPKNYYHKLPANQHTYITIDYQQTLKCLSIICDAKLHIMNIVKRGGASWQALAWTAKGSSIFALKKTRAFWSKRQQGFQPVSSWYRRTVCCTYEYCSLQTKLLGVRYYFSRHIVHTYVTYCMYIHTISLLTVPVLAGVCWR